MERFEIDARLAELEEFAAQKGLLSCITALRLVRQENVALTSKSRPVEASAIEDESVVQLLGKAGTAIGRLHVKLDRLISELPNSDDGKEFRKVAKKAAKSVENMQLKLSDIAEELK